jgi:enoyl-CoA hydratase/carnithine racemase
MAKAEMTIDGAVRTVVLNRADKRNALDGEMLSELSAAFTQPPGPGERVAVIRANGTVFCSGLDMRERARAPGGASSIEKMLYAIECYPLPVVGIVQGDAIAGGNELALHCDHVVASTSARFGMSLAQIGLAPSWFLAKKLMEVAGPVITKQILLLGDPVPAKRLYDLGVVAHLCEPADLEKTAAAIILRLADNAPMSLKTMKALINREMNFRDGIYHEDIDAMVEGVRLSHDAQEGIAARLEKRKAKFQGK